MRVLHLVPTFFPATYWGGPIHSSYGLCNALALRNGLEIRVLTSDAAGPKLSQKVNISRYPAIYPAGYEVYCCRRIALESFAPRIFAEMPRLIRWADVVHVTAVYSSPTIPALLLCRALGKPVVWSPRGALQRWQASTRPWLKASWDAICRSLIDPDRTVIHATSEREAEATRRRMPRSRIEIIPNGVDLPQFPQSRQWVPGGELRLLYLGRLHPIKGIENLLRALAILGETSISLRICGTGEALYADSLRTLAQSLGVQGRVSFVGEIATEKKREVFQSADICVVPSFSENFGLVVAESLAHGVPVIAARGTPWAGLEQHACGVWVNNAPDALADAIRKMKDRDLLAMGERGRSWMAECFGWDAIAGRMRDCYLSLGRRA